MIAGLIQWRVQAGCFTDHYLCSNFQFWLLQSKCYTHTLTIMFKWRLYPWVSLSGQLALISSPTVERETAPGWDFHPLVTLLSLSSHSLRTYKHEGAAIILISTTWEADLHCG